MPEPVIETLEDWNSQLAECGCCPMPTCPLPTKECESIEVTVAACGSSINDTYFTEPLSCADSSKYAKSEVTTNQIITSVQTSILNPNLSPLDGVYPTTTRTTTGYITTTKTNSYAYAQSPAGTKNRVCVSVDTCSGATTVSSVNSFPDGYFDVGVGEDPIPHETQSTQTCTYNTDCTVTAHYTSSGVDGYETISIDENVMGCGTPSTVATEWNSPVASGSYSDITPADIENGEYGSTYVYGVTSTYVFQELSDLSTEANLRITDIGAWDNANGSSCLSWMTATYGCDNQQGGISSISKSKSRYRWKVPDEHLGSYFKITWDVLNEPTGWNATTLLRTYYAEDQTFVWSGSVDRYSEWYDIPVLDFVGQRKIVNVRYECYGTTDYGNKPQVTGEAVTLPDT